MAARPEEFAAGRTSVKLILCAIDVVRHNRLHFRFGNGFNGGIAIEAAGKEGIAIEF